MNFEPKNLLSSLHRVWWKSVELCLRDPAEQINKQTDKGENRTPRKTQLRPRWAFNKGVGVVYGWRPACNTTNHTQPQIFRSDQTHKPTNAAL